MSRQNMDGLVRDIFSFKAENGESTTFDAYSGKHRYHVVKIPVAEDSSDFYRKAKRTQWIEQVLMESLADGDMGDTIRCMIDYIANRHGDVAREKLRELGLTGLRVSRFR